MQRHARPRPGQHASRRRTLLIATRPILVSLTPSRWPLHPASPPSTTIKTGWQNPTRHACTIPTSETNLTVSDLDSYPPSRTQMNHHTPAQRPWRTTRSLSPPTISAKADPQASKTPDYSPTLPTNIYLPSPDRAGARAHQLQLQVPPALFRPRGHFSQSLCTYGGA
jgi:hypothetical protein